jgi:hypothetical protein
MKEKFKTIIMTKTAIALVMASLCQNADGMPNIPVDPLAVPQSFSDVKEKFTDSVDRFIKIANESTDEFIAITKNNYEIGKLFKIVKDNLRALIGKSLVAEDVSTYRALLWPFFQYLYKNDPKRAMQLKDEYQKILKDHSNKPDVVTLSKYDNAKIKDIIGMNRDINLQLVKFLTNGDIREVFCIDKKYYTLWKNHCFFLASLRERDGEFAKGLDELKKFFVIKFGDAMK